MSCSRAPDVTRQSSVDAQKTAADAGDSRTGLNQESPPKLNGKQKDDWKWEWRSRIDFWGIVVDQKGEPVDGALVHCEWTDLSKEGTSHVTLVSNVDGRIELTNRVGKRLVVRASKDGYDSLDGSVASCEYAEKASQLYYTNTVDTPTVIVLRRKNSPSCLVYRRMMEFDLADRKSVAIDLLGQREVPIGGGNADLVVHVEPSTQRSSPTMTRFPWRVVVESPSGGVQRLEKREFIAPEHGYMPRVEFIGNPDDPRWRDDLESWVCVRSRGGSVHAVARLAVSPSPRFGSAAVTLLEYYANPSGDRGLEYSPQCDVTEKYYIPMEK